MMYTFVNNVNWGSNCVYFSCPSLFRPHLLVTTKYFNDYFYQLFRLHLKKAIENKQCKKKKKKRKEKNIRKNRYTASYDNFKRFILDDDRSKVTKKKGVNYSNRMFIIIIIMAIPLALYPFTTNVL